MTVDFSRYKRISVSRRGKVLTIALDNPPMNAIDQTMHDELKTIFFDAQDDLDSDVVVLTGAGNVFCAGGNIQDGMQKRINEVDSYHKKNLGVKRRISGMMDLEKPLIGRINGDCIGGGASLALFCDVIYAVDTARIGDRHVRMGLAAGDGASIIWPLLLGYTRAMEYLLTGDLLNGKKAAEIGLINHAVPAAKLDEVVNEFTDRLAAGATKSIRWTKVCANIHRRQAAQAFMDAGLAYQAHSNSSVDHQEAVNAFREKRKPLFTGK